MEESNKNEKKALLKRRSTQVGLFIILIAFVIYKFSLMNFFSFVLFQDAKSLVEDFERTYLYADVLKTDDYQKLKQEALSGPYTTKAKLAALVNYAKDQKADPYTEFSYSDVLQGKFAYSNYVRLRFESKVIDGNKAYIKINTFNQGVDKKFERAIKKMKNEEYLVLDLRGNHRGYAEQMVPIVDLLLPENAPIGYIEFLHSKHDYNSDPFHYSFKKIYVLLDEKSGGNAEMMALALKENLGDKVELVGKKTMHKNIGQFYKSYYNKIDMDVAAYRWSVKDKTSEELDKYLTKYSAVELDGLKDYLKVVESIK